MMAITRENDFASRAAGEWRNSSEQVIAIIREYNTTLFYYEKKLINMFHY
jgi:hypothetical protein